MRTKAEISERIIILTALKLKQYNKLKKELEV